MKTPEVGMARRERNGELAAVCVTGEHEVRAAFGRALEIRGVVGEKDCGDIARSLQKDTIEIRAVRPAIVDSADEETFAHIVSFISEDARAA
jgi:hypothetical protein